MREKPEEERPSTQKDFFPVALKNSELLASFPERSYPPIQGYVETDLKKGASLDLMISQTVDRAPLLASWSYGRGKAAAFATDFQGAWTRDWIRWPSVEKFWDAVFTWLTPSAESVPPHEVRINLEGNQPILDLYAYGRESGNSVFRYHFKGKGSDGQGTLKKLAPGHYRVMLPIAVPGDYRVELNEEAQGRKVPYPPVGYTLTFRPGAEIPRDRFNIPLLEELADATGGQINPQPGREQETERVSRTSIPLRSPLILVTAILFLLEVFFRRFVLGLEV
jgi:hypothetical protein